MDDQFQDQPPLETTIDRARHGDRAARAVLLRRLQDPWYRMCLGLLGDAERARDATQEAGLRFLRQLPRFRGESQLQTWAMGIAINVAREMRRACRPIEARRVEANRPAVESAESAASRGEDEERLSAALAELPERQREAVMLRFFEELSVEQTAQAMRCAAGTVKATVHQALRSLRQRLHALVVDDRRG